MPKPTKPSNTPTIYIRQPLPAHLLADHIKRIAEEHRTNPKTIEVHIGINQMEFIKKCIIEATNNNPALAAELDEWDDPMGETLVDLIDMTVKDPGEYGTLHGWVV